MKKSLLLLLLSTLFMGATVMAQMTVSGTVTDNGGETLIGVNIIEKGTTNGTVTDLDGNYSMRVADGATLIFSYVGFETFEKIVDGSSIDIVMSDANILDEVVVTGLGISKDEKGLSYAVTQVDGDDFAKARESNVLNSLSGTVSGVQVTSSSSAVGSSSRVVLRGVASITGNNQPLYVVDGIAVDSRDYGTANGSGGYDLPNGIAEINTDDIESVTVLKGGAAANLWGMRAANGVILITTKRGQKNQKLGVSFNSSTTFERPLVLPDFQNSYGGGYSKDYFEFINGNDGDGGADESWGPPLDVGLEFVQWNSPEGSPTPWVSYPDNVKDFYETGVTTNNSLAFTGGSENMTYRMSFGQEYKKGMVPSTDFKKYNINASTYFDVTDKLSGNVNFNYIKSLSNNIPEVGYGSDNIVSQMLWTQRQINFTELKDWENLPLATGGFTGPNVPINWNTSFNNNPYWILDNNTNSYDKNRIIGGIGLAYAFTDYLALGLKSSIDYFAQFNASQKAIGSSTQDGYVNGWYSERHRNFSQINAEASLTFDKTFADDYNVTAFFGGNLMTQNYKRIRGEAPALELPGLYNLSNVQNGASVILTNNLDKSKINSVYGTLGFNWRSSVFVDFSFRNDWASVLPSDNRSFFYPAVGGAVLLSEFIPKNDILSFLKLRGSWSKIGSAGVLDPYDIVQTFTFRANPWGSTGLVYDPLTLNNPNLIPETTKEYEVGVDVRLAKSRLRIDFSYYNSLGEGLIVPLQVSSSSGYTGAFKNVGVIRNKGYEITAGATLYKNQSKDLNIDLDINWAKNKNNVESLGGLDAYVISDNPFDIAFQAREGMPYGLLVGRDFVRDESGNVVHEDGLPVTNTDETIVHGTVQPDWTGGVRFTLGWRGLTFTTLIDAKVGGIMHTLGYQTGMLTGNYEETLLGRETGLIAEGVMNIGTASEPVYVENNVVVTAQSYFGSAFDYSVSSPGIFDASYVKWRELIVGYSLPDKLFEQSVIDQISISLIARNLAIIHKNVPHIDPESGFSSGNADIGQEFGQWPTTRSIGFNVNVQF